MKEQDKLAVCINALRKISGDPRLDREIVEAGGEPPEASPSVRCARQALATIGVLMDAPITQRMDQ
jgi:hypothetical protein